MCKISKIFTLYNDASVIEKLTVMNKLEAMLDDARNPELFTEEEIDQFFKLGKRYRITIEEVTDA